MSTATDATGEVFVDPYTRLFHRETEAAGPDATAFSKAQAELLGHRPCPDCYGPTADAGGVEA